MSMIINGIDFQNLAPQKYYAPPASWDEEKKKRTARERIFSGDWFGAEKKDGYFTKFVKDMNGNIGLFSRSKNVNGEYPEKHEWVPHLQSFFDSLPNGTCLLGELYLPSKPGSSNITSLLGCLKEKCIARQESGEKLHFYVFDILAWEGKSYIKMPFIDRIDELNLMWRAGYMNEYVEIAKYLSGTELWNALQRILAEGGEGMVITRGGAPYQPGKRPSKDCLKIKKELAENIDCFFTGRASAPTRLYTGSEIVTWKYWENPHTGEKIDGECYKQYYAGAPIEPVTKPYFNGWAGSLEIGVMKDGEVCPIGFLSGLTDEVKANFKSYKGRCIEMAAMEVLHDTKGIRHGKFLRFRDDLEPSDCTWEKIFG